MRLFAKTPMTLELLFQLLAVTLGAVAALLFWYGNTDAMFVAAVLGAVSFFLSIRMQVRSRLKEREVEKLSNNTPDT